MKIIIVGKNGMLGEALTRHAISLNFIEGKDFAALDLPDFDVTSRRFALETLCEFQPEAIINTSGVNMIDWLEKRPNTARTVHVQGVANLREAAKRTGALLVQISCAEVFGQTSDAANDDFCNDFNDAQDVDNSEFASFGGRLYTDELREHFEPKQTTEDNAAKSISADDFSPFLEDITPEPVSVYAKTKLDGERAAREAPKHLVVRTGPLFGKVGRHSTGNLVETLLHSLRRQEKVSVINDQWASYTWADDLARAIFALIERNCTGLYHVTNSGMASPYEVACEILHQTGVKRDYETIAMSDYGFVAPRARYTVLDCSKYRAVESVPQLPDWQTALQNYLASRSAM